MKVDKSYKLKNATGSTIKDLRMRRGLSQSQLSMELVPYNVNLSYNDISKIENNNRMVKDFELFAIAKALGVSVEKLEAQQMIIDEEKI